MSEPTVILASKNALRIANRRPTALVIDLANARFVRGCECFPASISGRATFQFRTAAAILLRVNGKLSHDELTDVLYGEAADGGPDDPSRVHYIVLCRLKPFLRWAGLTVRSRQKVLHIAWASNSRILPAPLAHEIRRAA